MQFEMKRDSPAIRRIEKRIAEVELANRYVKKTTRLNHNMKKIVTLNKDLNRALYHHNKYDIFDLFEKIYTKIYTEELDKRFTNLAHIKDLDKRMESWKFQ